MKSPILNFQFSIFNLCLLLAGCSLQQPELPADHVRVSETGEDLKLVHIDGCQYFKLLTYGGNYSFTHKGNCTNHTAYLVKDLTVYGYDTKHP
jgi:hypothetical protein